MEFGKKSTFTIVFTLIVMAMMLISAFSLLDFNDRSLESPASNEAETVPTTGVEINRDENGQILTIGLPVDPAKTNVPKPINPVTTTPGTRGQWDQIIMQEDFESPTWWAKWSQLEDENPSSNGDWWGRDNDAPYVKTGSWSCNCSANFSGSPAGGAGVGYDNNMVAWMTYGPIDLSSTAGLIRCAKLTFWYWLDCQGGGNDFFFFGASNGDAPGGVMTFYPPTWSTQSITSGRLRNWRWVDFNLTDTNAIGTSLPGDPNVYIAFYFKSDTSLCGLAPQNYKGAYVDDITLWNYTNHAPLAPEGLNVSAPYGNTRRVVDHTPTLNWTFVDPDSGVEEYPTGFHVQVGTDDDWAAAEMAEVNQTYNGYLAPNWEYTSANQLLDGQRYYFRVKARDADFFWSPWSQTFNFSMNDEPTIPTLTDPTSGVIWDGGVPESHWINWTVATNNDDNPPQNDTITINVTLSTDGGNTYSRNVIQSETNDGSYYWDPIFNDVESNQCIIRVTAFDGFEATHAYTPVMTIDSYAPVINDIITTSTKTWFYEEPSMGATGGTVWFNSLAGEGSGQVLTMNLNWSDASRVLATGSAAFGDTPSDADSEPVALDYSVETNAGNFMGVTLTVTDYFSRTDTANINFKVDNTDPSAPLSVTCHPDSYTDVGEADNDTEIYVTWTDGNDAAGCGISHSIIYTTDINTAVKNITKGNGIYVSPVSDLTIEVNVSMVDKVGNIGPSDSDLITIDFIEPQPPVSYSDTHPDDTEWYSNNDPVLNWTPPTDLSGINGYSYELDQVVDTVPPDSLQGTMTSKKYYDNEDGVWYFHLRAMDNASHWGPTSHFTVNIDTIPPNIMKDYSDDAATTGETVYFKVEANDDFCGVGEVRLYWRHTGETAYRIVPMELTAAEQYDCEFQVPQNNAANIEYYIMVNDSAIPTNTAYTPDRMVKEFEEITVNDNDLPVITEITGDTIGYTGDIITIEVNTSDNVDVISAKIYIVPDKMGKTMAEAPDNKFTYDIEVSENNLDDIIYYVKVWDAATNSARSPAHSGETYTITVKDNDPPIVLDITRDTVGTSGQTVEIFVEADDKYDYGKDMTAKLYIGTDIENPSVIDMDHISGDKFRVTYNIPKFILEDLKYYITVMDTSLNTVRAPAVGEYTIYIPVILEPNGGEVWNGIRNITWAPKDMPETTPVVDIYYWDSTESLYKSIAKGEPDDGFHEWDTTSIKDGMGYKIRIRVQFSPELIATDESDNPFRIYNPDAPELDVKYPIGGERLTGATTIQYLATDEDGDEVTVKLEYRESTTEADENWTLLGYDTLNTGNFSWNTKTVPDGEYYLRITATDKSVEQLSVEHTTFDTIEVDNELSIAIQAPLSGETWSGSKDILWDISDAHGNTIFIDIQYRKTSDPPTSWQNVTTEKLQNVGIHKWDTATAPNGEYYIKIHGYVTLGGEREGVVISQPFTIHNKKEDVSGFGEIFAWIIIILIIALIIILSVVMFVNKKKKGEELKKEAEKLKAKDAGRPRGMELPSGPQIYTMPPTRPEPLYPVEPQRYRPIAPPPPPSLKQQPAAAQQAPVPSTSTPPPPPQRQKLPPATRPKPQQPKSQGSSPSPVKPNIKQ